MKVLKLIVAMAMMMSLLIVGANAAFSDQDKIEYAEAVDMAATLKIIKGRDDGTFDPKGQVTRAEMAKVICIILNAGKEPTLGVKPTSSFKDSEGHWAEPYIEFCTSLGSVSGLGDGNFNPDGSVTSTQAAKMLLVLLGYDAELEQFSGSNWFLKINAAANQKNLYNELTIDPNAPLTRDEAAQMIWNTLNASEVEYKASTTNVNGQVNKTPVHEEKEGNLLKSKFHTDGDCKGVMTNYRWNEVDKCFVYEIQDQGTFSSGIDYTHLFGLTVNVVHKDDTAKTIYGMYPSNSKVLAAGEAGDLGVGSTAKEIQFNKVNYEINYSVSAANASPADALNALPAYAENDGENRGTYLGAALSVHKHYEVRLIDQNGNGKVDSVVYLPFAIGQVSNVSAESVTVKDLTGCDINGKTFIVLDRNNDQRIYDRVVEADYVKIIPQKNTAYQGHQVLPLNSFEGTVTGIKDGKIQVKDTWYNNGNSLTVVKDKAYRFYAGGSYLYYIEDAYAPTIDQLVYLQTAAEGTGTTVDGKLYFAGGSSKTVPIKAIKLHVSANLITFDQDKFDYVFGPNTADRYTSFLKLAKGETGLYTYIEKNNEYTLTEVCKTNKVGFGGYAADPTTARVTPAENGKVGILQMKGISYSFADDAVVFVDAADCVHVITGAKAKNFKTELANVNAVALFNTSSTNGANEVKVAMIQTAAPLPEDKSETSTK